MRDIVLLRHAATPWNRDGRIQGRRDVALAAAGRAELSRRRLPACWRDGEWRVSPLARARESAALLGASSPAVDAALEEMDWGEWEGARLADLRAAHGEAMARNEARGLDFRPPGGESPRDVRERLAGWLGGLDPTGAPVLAMTHKGVIRAALSLATGWDMRVGFRPRPDWACAQVFRRDAAGAFVVHRLNVPLERRGG